MTLKLKSHCIKTLETYLLYIQNNLKLLNLSSNSFFLPKKEKRITLLRSPHVFKKSKEHFKLTKYTVILKIKNNNNSKLDINSFYYLFLNKPNSINIITKI